MSKRQPLLVFMLLSCLVAPAVASAAPRDRDHDGLPDRWEQRYALSITRPSAAADPDHDRLNNRAEHRAGTNPRKSDTDGDHVTDGTEVAAGSDPRNQSSVSVGAVSLLRASPMRRTTSAAFSLTPSHPQLGTVAKFDGSGSRCAVTPCTYAWIDDGSDGPGGTDWPLGWGKTLSYTFQDAGTKHLRLHVTDALRRTADATRDVTVSTAPALAPAPVPAPAPAPPPVPAPTPAAPTASMTIMPGSPTAGLAATLDGSASQCAVTPCTYAWIDDGSDGPGGTDWPLGSGKTLNYTFQDAATKHLRLHVTDALSRTADATRDVTVSTAPAPAPSPAPAPAPTPTPTPTPAPTPDPGLPPLGQPSCQAGATNVTTGSALRSAVQAGQNVCVTAPVGAVNLDSLTSSATRYVGTSGGGSLGAVDVSGSSNLTFRARMLSMYVGGSDHVTIEESVLGGTSASRTLETLVYLNGSSDVTIRDSELAWTTADNSGNTGYGIRGVYVLDRLTIQRNYIHHIGADGIQLGTDGSDITIDRNEFAYVAPPSTSNEHSDDIQIIGNGPNMRITNNYLHLNGLYAAGQQTGGSGPYIHAGTTNSLLFENNIVRDESNYMQVGGLGTGGCARSNLTFRGNTLYNDGLMWGGAGGPDLQWRLCSGSANNAYDRNLVVAQFGQDNGWAASGTTATGYLHGQYSLDADGNCTDAACNPAGHSPIGYRKPTRVHW